MNFQLYLNSLSWGVGLVDALGRNLTKWSASGRTFSQWESCMLRECKVT